MQPTPVDAPESGVISTTGGYTDLGAALDLLAPQLAPPHMEERSLPPAILLISDGMPTDDYKPALARFLDEPMGRAAVRMAVGIGRDADLEVLERFVDSPEHGVLDGQQSRATRPDDPLGVDHASTRRLELSRRRAQLVAALSATRCRARSELIW